MPRKPKPLTCKDCIQRPVQTKRKGVPLCAKHEAERVAKSTAQRKRSALNAVTIPPCSTPEELEAMENADETLSRWITLKNEEVVYVVDVLLIRIGEISDTFKECVSIVESMKVCVMPLSSSH